MGNCLKSKSRYIKDEIPNPKIINAIKIIVAYEIAKLENRIMDKNMEITNKNVNNLYN